MKRILLLVVCSICLALPMAVATTACADTTTTVIEDRNVKSTTEIDRTETEVDLSATSDDSTNRILLWGGVILVAALIIGLAMHNRSSSARTDVHID